MLDDPSQRRWTRRTVLRASGLAGVGMLAPSLLAACGGGAKPAGGPDPTGTTPATSEAQIGSLTWGHSAPPAALDFAQSWDYTTPIVLANSIEGLLVLDEKWAVRPHLAKSFDRPDALTYVFDLRDDVTFWDGSPVKPEDVIYSYMRNLDPKFPSQTAILFSRIDTARQTGPRQITFKLKSPDPFLQFVAAHPAGGIISKAFAEKAGKRFGTPQGLTMGTGPMEITEFVGGDHVTTERFANYWGAPSKATAITHRFIPDDQARLLALQSGQVDGTFALPPDLSRQAQRASNLSVVVKPSLQSHIYELDMQKAPTDDINVRKAIFHSVDRQGLVASVLHGHGEPSSIEVPPEQWGSLMSADAVRQLYSTFPEPTFDLDAARASLAKSSYKDISFDVTFASSLQRVGQGLQNTAANLKEIGIDMNVRPVPDAQWFSDQAKHLTGFRASIWVPDYPDPADYPSFNFDSVNAVPGQYNMGNLKSPKIDALLKQQYSELDPAKRADTIARMLKEASEMYVYIPVWWEEANMVTSNKLTLPEYDAFVGYRPWATQLRATA